MRWLHRRVRAAHGSGDVRYDLYRPVDGLRGDALRGAGNTVGDTCGTAGQCLGDTSEAFNGAGRRFGGALRGGRGGIADRSHFDRQPGYLVPR